MAFDVPVYILARRERIDLEVVQGLECNLNNSLEHIQKFG